MAGAPLPAELLHVEGPVAVPPARTARGGGVGQKHGIETWGEFLAQYLAEITNWMTL